MFNVLNMRVKVFRDDSALSQVALGSWIPMQARKSDLTTGSGRGEAIRKASAGRDLRNSNLAVLSD